MSQKRDIREDYQSKIKSGINYFLELVKEGFQMFDWYLISDIDKKNRLEQELFN